MRDRSPLLWLLVAVVGIGLVVTPVVAASDMFEPNDTERTAASITVGETYTGLYTADDDTYDYYEFTVAEGERITAYVNYTSSADIRLYLYDPDGVDIGRTFTTADGQAEAALAPEDGTYQLLVQYFGGGPTNYNLTVETNVTGDRFERNDDKSSATPLPASGGTTVYDDLNITRGDEDYFNFTAESGQEINATVAFDDSSASIDAQLIGPDGTTILTDANPGTTDLELTHTTTQSGTYYVRVYSLDDGGPYSLEWTPPACGFDSLVAGYDRNGDCGISLIELGRASRDFANGDISLIELGSVSRAFANS